MKIYLLSLACFTIALYFIGSDSPFMAFMFGALFGFFRNESYSQRRVDKLEETLKNYERYIKKLEEYV